MSRKLVATQENDACRRYLAGEAGTALAREFGVSSAVIYRVLRTRGIPVRDKRAVMDLRPKVLSGHEPTIIGRYRSGETANGIAIDYGVSEATVYELLYKFNVVRTRSEATVLAASKRTEEDVRRQAEKQRRAMTGLKRQRSQFVQGALTRQARGIGITEDERRLAEWLEDRGVSVIHQMAIGPYNVDIGTSAVAVEIFGGGWHAYGAHRRKLAERSRYILDAGLALHFIWVMPAHHPLTPDAADDVISFIQTTGGNPPARRKYRVIWGTGQFIASGDGYPDEFALIPTGRRRDYRRA